jgi:uridylate kinase
VPSQHFEHGGLREARKVLRTRRRFEVAVVIGGGKLV